MTNSTFTSFLEERAKDLHIPSTKQLSLLDDKACDPAYAQEPKPSGSRGKSFLKKRSSIKQAFIMSIIFQKFGE